MTPTSSTPTPTPKMCLHVSAWPATQCAVCGDTQVLRLFDHLADAERQIEALSDLSHTVTALTKERDDLRRALEWYARGGGCAETIEDAARGDIDLARASEALTEDCGDKARAALNLTPS